MWLGTRSLWCLSEDCCRCSRGPWSVEILPPEPGGLPVGDVGVLGRRSSGELGVRIVGRTVERSWQRNGSVSSRCSRTGRGVT